MYTAELLLADAASFQHNLAKRNADEVPQAWEAFTRYITEVMGKKQTLNVSNFCRIGWKVEEGLHQPRMRPHFNISDAFAISCRADARSQLQGPAHSLTHVEEFNFSKCALKFSNGLTKDRMFMCLRAIIQQLTEAIASGREVGLEMGVGTLRSCQRVVSFSFSAELYASEGLQVPPDAAEQSRPAKTFTPPSKDALSLTDSKQFRGTVKATDLGGFHDTGTPAAFALGSSSGSGMSKEELAQREARDRHLADISEEAEEAVQQRELWQNHLRRCMEEEKKDMDWRSAIERDYREMLKDQIREHQLRREEAKRASVEQASMHGFPDFSKPSSISVKDYIVERRLHLKEDLDHQVELKKRQKEHRKAIEHEMDRVNNLAAHTELVQQRVKDRERGRHVLQECLQNWEDTKRIKDAKAAITQFKKSPAASGVGLADMVSSLRSDAGAARCLSAREKTPSNPPMAVPKARSERPQKVNIAAELPPATPSEDAVSMPLSSRPTTGSVRRFPISAAANLALTKKRLKERGMM
mmetsp:Transcript_43419/g.101401  ORF Transcript_43419/g.101401 Transcript_43419/m.101401 type:complete len:527 (-) Transcript_43419:69-1649(-)